MSVRSRQTVLGIGFAGLMLQMVVQEPLFSTRNVELFKVVTPRDTLVIGLSRNELADMHASGATDVARAINNAGTMNVWQYGIRRNAAGDLEQAPVRQIGLMSAAALHVEAYDTPLKVIPVSTVQMH